ncbi:hypothetical protein CL634_07435 [bacterium]|nr:hypothetical protein [bacterium]
MTPKRKQKNTKAWVVAVDMGYGHQRAAYPLHNLAYQNIIINANTYSGIPKRDRKLWRQSRKIYEFISRFKKVPLLGPLAFGIMDRFQRVEPFYPRHDHVDPTFQVKEIYHVMKDDSWGKHLVESLASKGGDSTPLIATFFIPAFMAEQWDYPGPIYCLATDTDISRGWAPLKPTNTKIKYFAPTARAKERLQSYGIPKENIFLTGFPLPEELLGGSGQEIAKANLKRRLPHLDPAGVYRDRYAGVVEDHVGRMAANGNGSDNGRVHIMFAVGGAGAQRELGAQIALSLSKLIRQGKIKLTLVAGIHNDVHRYFRQALRPARLSRQLGDGVEILNAPKKVEYFKLFNKAMARADILWTKPSELSFYAALGIPIIIAPPIGSQELFNKDWLIKSGAGLVQGDPAVADQWLPDWLAKGWLAEAAMQGFVELPNMGTANIARVLSGQEPIK